MPIEEIASVEDARTRLKQLFGSELEREDDYVEVLSLMCKCGGDQFALALERLSKRIWKRYNLHDIRTARNRFTRAILRVGTEKYGFSCKDNVVFTGPLDSKPFKDRIADKVLWKDSFALDHGEFSHSYQWMSLGQHKDWGTRTSEVYASVSQVRSKEPIFHITSGRLELATVPLWEWMVDCTLYKPEFDSKVATAVDAYFDKQLDAWAKNDPANHPVNTYFVQAFIRANGLADRRGEAGIAATVRKDFAQAIATFKRTQVERYPRCSALTATSYRSANNVTTLVRLRKDWFISVYERHRTGFRGDLAFAREERRADDAAHFEDAMSARPGVLDEAQARGQAALIRDLRQVNPGWSKAPRVDDDLKFGRTPKGQNASVQVVTGGSTVNFKNAHPIEGIKYDRAAHYGGKQWSNPAKYVYEHGAVQGEPVDKTYAACKFHGVEGDMNPKPYEVIALMK